MISNKKTLIELIEDLKECYQIFSSQWNEWINYKGHQDYLTEEELYAISIYKKNNFKISIAEQVMFYHKVELIEQISLKLKNSKKEFKEWLIERWMFSVLNIVLGNDIMTLVETPIDQLNICEELKGILKKFEKKTITEIFDFYSDKVFMEDFHFNLILNFMTVLKKQKTVCVNQ